MPSAPMLTFLSRAVLAVSAKQVWPLRLVFVLLN
jgi:hypothetical protein